MAAAGRRDMKASLLALLLTFLAGSGASGFTETFEVNIFQPAFRQKSIAGSRGVPAEERRNAPRPVKPPTPQERSLFQRLFRPE
jgi:hypothetical protein